jgi:hypothetical protein
LQRRPTGANGYSEDGLAAGYFDQGAEGDGEMIKGARRPWTAAEDDLLKEMAMSGQTPGSIAIHLKRTQDAVQSRVFRLRVSSIGLKAKK